MNVCVCVCVYDCVLVCLFACVCVCVFTLFTNTGYISLL